MCHTQVIGYVRVSTAAQSDGGISLDAQRAKIQAYAELYDLELVDIIEDGGYSAKSLVRPGLARALALLEGGAAKGLLVAKLDRLTRSVRDLGDLIERYFASRFDLLSVGENIDTRSAAGRLVLNILGSVGQWERETTGERTKDALGQLRTEGVRLGGAALGWRRAEAVDQDGRRCVERVDDEVATWARVQELRAAGLSLRDIIACLEGEGRRTKRGGRWAPETVRRLIARGEQRGAA